MATINAAVVKGPWKDLAPGPVGEYVEVIDVILAHTLASFTGCTTAVSGQFHND
jgi:hypothetical protein